MCFPIVYLGDVRHSGDRRCHRVARRFSRFVRSPPVSFIWRTLKFSEEADLSLPKVYLLQNWRSIKGSIQVRRALSNKMRGAVILYPPCGYIKLGPRYHVILGMTFDDWAKLVFYSILTS